MLFSSEILHLYLDFIQFTVEKIDSHIQVVPNLLKSFPKIVSVSKFQFELLKMKWNLKVRPWVALATFHVVSSHVRMVASVLGSMGLDSEWFRVWALGWGRVSVRNKGQNRRACLASISMIWWEGAGLNGLWLPLSSSSFAKPRSTDLAILLGCLPRGCWLSDYVKHKAQAFLVFVKLCHLFSQVLL